MEITLKEVIIRIVVAAVLGGVIGMERQIKGKVAGLRTTMLICIGSALFMILSQLAANRTTGDMGRIAAQVVSGIGFLGAGAILHSRAGIIGLTTAATIFVVAAIGLASGGGYWQPALVTTIVVLFTLQLLGKLEGYIQNTYQTLCYSFSTNDAEGLLQKLESLAAELKVAMEEIELQKEKDAYRIRFNITATTETNQTIMRKFLSIGSLSSVTTPTGSAINGKKNEGDDK